jgi:hypothetical protein
MIGSECVAQLRRVLRSKDDLNKRLATVNLALIGYVRPNRMSPNYFTEVLRISICTPPLGSIFIKTNY